MVAEHIPPAVEAILMVAEDPLPPELLAQLVGTSAEEIDEVCESLAHQYVVEGRGFILARVAGGFRYQTATEQAPYVERFVLEGQSSRLSAAALETLAVVAYKQPVSRNQIAAIRGVNVDSVMRTLQQRGYVDEVARDPGPGQAVLYGTTPTFLERLGLDSISELPPLGEFFPGSDVVEALEHGLRVVPDDEFIELDDGDVDRDGDGVEADGAVASDDES
ncbi:MAG: SMC-Scp complex subunit ScpB [Acidimicrobiales bacterium]|nr:SMC-Scp complex subunit ScpB [Acidimicrobiales bacterium]